jgi:hypothetical protein
MAVEGALRTEEAGGLVDAIVGASEDSIVEEHFSVPKYSRMPTKSNWLIEGGKVKK